MFPTPGDMDEPLRGEPVAAYCWGGSGDVQFAYVALSGSGLAGVVDGTRDYAPSRPPLDEQVWQQVDRALDEACRACELRLIIALVPKDAENLAQSLFVWAEPGPDVIAIGHMDRTVSLCMTDDTVEVNGTSLRALLHDAGLALQRGDLETALRSVASNVGSLRLPARLRGKLPPPIPRR